LHGERLVALDNTLPFQQEKTMQRRDFLSLAALGGGAVYVSALAGCAHRTDADAKGQADAGYASAQSFYFVQLSDTHWGYSGPANPDAAVTLPKAVAAVNALAEPPDFVIFTGDLTHTTDDADERRRRLAEFKRIVGGLKVPDVRFIPGEHDASLDHGVAFKEYFGDTYFAFEHKGVHFIALDNVSDPGAKIDDAQMQWFKAELDKLDKQAPIVVITHRPLFDLAPKWDWATRNGAAVMALLMPYQNVTVFYGHIHQEHHHMTGHIAHHSAKSLIFPLPAPGSQDKRTPLPWDPSQPYKGLGFREIESEQTGKAFELAEFPVVSA
jgi:hypothetical protein